MVGHAERVTINLRDLEVAVEAPASSRPWFPVSDLIGQWRPTKSGAMSKRGLQTPWGLASRVD